MTHWSDEVVQTTRRGNDLRKHLTTGAQINGDYVIAPQVARDAVARAATEIGQAFARLQGSVTEGRNDLMESITLHDLMQDIDDLEVRHGYGFSNCLGIIGRPY